MSSVVIDVGARRSACSAVERFAPRECGRDLPWVKLGIEALMWGMQSRSREAAIIERVFEC
jgi:hypothetical protein